MTAAPLTIFSTILLFTRDQHHGNQNPRETQKNYVLPYFHQRCLTPANIEAYGIPFFWQKRFLNDGAPKLVGISYLFLQCEHVLHVVHGFGHRAAPSVYSGYVLSQRGIELLIILRASEKKNGAPFHRSMFQLVLLAANITFPRRVLPRLAVQQKFLRSF